MYIVLTEMARGKRQETSIFFDISSGFGGPDVPKPEIRGKNGKKIILSGLVFPAKKKYSTSRFVSGPPRRMIRDEAFVVVHIPARGAERRDEKDRF